MSIELTAIGNLSNELSSIGAINRNFEKIETAINDIIWHEFFLRYPIDCNGQALMNAVIPDGAQIGNMSVATLLATIRILTQRIEALEGRR
ncbi:hypothetical protein [Trabulsiella guamensis]|uniref:hypothetical protein n=1 Tax=Trabulsiella guamensis TaxID=158852 RepID=UPI000571E8C8|nr:hypothetical protein [Trabulsiella guamensis]